MNKLLNITLLNITLLNVHLLKKPNHTYYLNISINNHNITIKSYDLNMISYRYFLYSEIKLNNPIFDYITIPEFFRKFKKDIHYSNIYSNDNNNLIINTSPSHIKFLYNKGLFMNESHINRIIDNYYNYTNQIINLSNKENILNNLQNLNNILKSF